jgi:uncharacterized membrane protein
MTLVRPRRLVKLSLLEYEDKHVPIPLFGVSVGLMTGFTLIFPILGILTLPTAVFIIFSILTEDITFVDENLNQNSDLEEE